MTSSDAMQCNACRATRRLANPPAALAIQRLDSKDLRVSHLEIELAQRTELLLSTEPRFAALGGGAAHTHLMKGILSWAQLLGPAVEEKDFQLAVPFVYVYAKDQQEPSQRAINTIASMFQWVRADWLPKVVSPRARVDAASSILTLFESRDPNIYRGLKAGLQGASGGPAHGLAELLKPLVETAFVGDLPIEVSVFIWDQTFLASTAQLDAVKYYCAAILICLKQMLLPCTTLAAMQHVVKDYTPRLTIRQLQGAIDHHFAEQMRQELRLGAEREAIPVEDVVLATQQLPQWSAWAGGGPDKRPTAADRAIAQQHKDAKQQTKEMAALKAEIKKRREVDAKRIAETRAKRAALEVEQLQLNEIVVAEQAKTEEAEAKRDAMMAAIELERSKRLIAEDAMKEQRASVTEFTVDKDGDGIADMIMVDLDGDGVIDELRTLDENGHVETVDTLNGGAGGPNPFGLDKTFITGEVTSASKRHSVAGLPIPIVQPGHDLRNQQAILGGGDSKRETNQPIKVEFNDPKSIFGALIKTAMFRFEQLAMPTAVLSKIQVDAYHDAVDGATQELYGKSLDDLKADNSGVLTDSWRKAIRTKLPAVYVKQSKENGTAEEIAAVKIQAGFRGMKSRRSTQTLKDKKKKKKSKRKSTDSSTFRNSDSKSTPLPDADADADAKVGAAVRAGSAGASSSAAPSKHDTLVSAVFPAGEAAVGSDLDDPDVRDTAL